MKKEVILKFYYTDATDVAVFDKMVTVLEGYVKKDLMITAQNNQPVAISNRKKWLRNVTTAKEHLFLLMSAEKEPIITYTGFYYPEILYANTPLWQTIVKLPEGTVDRSKLDLLAKSLGEIGNAFWGAVYPSSISLKVSLQSQPSYAPAQLEDLPKLGAPMNYPSPYIPANLGFINYWSNQTLIEMNVPNDVLATLFYKITPTTYGLITQLAENQQIDEEEVLLKRLKKVYTELPYLGGQSL